MNRIEAQSARSSIRGFVVLVAINFAAVSAALADPPSGMPSPAAGDAQIAVGPQYDTAHVYLAAGDFDTFVASFLATFGGEASKRAATTVTPTPSSAEFQYLRTPAGGLSIFAYSTPVPFPFGQERTGYLVADMDQAIKAARANGAAVVVEPFKDPIGVDAVIEWPGGVKMQLYWHLTAPHYEALATIPENRVYVSPDSEHALIRGFVRFSHGKLTADDRSADAAEIGRPGEVYRRLRIESPFGKMLVMVTDGHLPYPYGYETMGYEVASLKTTLGKAKTAGVIILRAPIQTDTRRSAMLRFPGGFIAEVHEQTRR